MEKLEKRARTRIRYLEQVRVRIENTVRENLQCRDISFNGLFLEGTADVDVGMRVDIDLLFLEGSMEYCVHIKGTIARKDAHGFAVKFSEMDEDSFLHLKRMIEYRRGDAEGVEKELTVPAFEAD